MDKVKKAVELFNSGYNCAQAVLMTYSDKLSTDVAVKISCPFGAGMGYLSQTCGAVSGALMVIGMHQNMNENNQLNKVDVYKNVQKFAKEFIKINGSINCQEITGYDLSDEIQKSKAEELGIFKTKCLVCVRSAVEILEKFIG